MTQSIRSHVRRLLPEPVRRHLRSVRERAAAQAARAFAVTSWTSSLYYLFDRSFRREHQAVLAAKWAYHRNLSARSGSSPMLRRNIHRIEKGLVSRPLRPVFAAGYIEETVRVFSSRVEAQFGEIPATGELRWAHDVLRHYFATVEERPAVARARAAFEGVLADRTVATRPTAIAPYERDLAEPVPVGYDAFLALSVRRRSVRWFEQRPVPRDAIDRAILAAGYAPTACNRQPYRFLVYDEPELVSKVSTIPGGTRGFAHNFPVVVVLVGTLSAFFSERDRHLIYIDGSLAAMAFMYALETQGLSSCSINWPDLAGKERALARLIGLTPDERVVMLMAVGHPDPNGLVPSSEKRVLDDVRYFNRVRADG